MRRRRKTRTSWGVGVGGADVPAGWRAVVGDVGSEEALRDWEEEGRFREPRYRPIVVEWLVVVVVAARGGACCCGVDQWRELAALLALPVFRRIHVGECMGEWIVALGPDVETL